MKYHDTKAQLDAYRAEIAAIRTKMRAAQQSIEPQSVPDYALETPQGSVLLSSLFGGHRDLYVVHNMGRGCAYCTLWADGYNGVYPHLASRAAFVVSSPDAPEVQRAFAAERGWRFPMVSHRGTSFAADLGYCGPQGDFRPGVSLFRRDGDRLLRVSDSGSRPLDDFCALWHLFEMLPEGPEGWRPRLHYPDSVTSS